eukprot:gene907-793_t
MVTSPKLSPMHSPKAMAKREVHLSSVITNSPSAVLPDPMVKNT